MHTYKSDATIDMYNQHTHTQTYALSICHSVCVSQSQKVNKIKQSLLPETQYLINLLINIKFYINVINKKIYIHHII